MNEAKRKMAPQNSTLINLINDDIKSITSERMSPIRRDFEDSSSDEESETDEEIPIFIGHVPRYVSGINRKTTCNDIIKALIDDELANTKVGSGVQVCPEHYTIFERFQDIEHALDGDELIYDLWRNWGERNDVQFRLKINKEKQDEILERKTKAKKIKNPGIKKLLKKVLYQGEIIHKHLQDLAKPQEVFSEYEFRRNPVYSSLPTCSQAQFYAPSQASTDTEDELFLVIDHHNDNDSGVFITKEQRFFHEMEIDQRTDIGDTPKRKLRYSRDYESLKDHAINAFNSQDDFARASFKFEQVHKEIRTKIDGMKEIIDQEHSFLRKINKYSFDDNETQSEYQFVDNVTEYCDNNETMIV